MKTVFLICGESGCGKSRIAKELCEHFGYSQIVSYTTRPCRGEHDTDHIFITEDDVEYYRSKIIAYTEIGDYKYFATISQLWENDLYIIDPYGIQYLKSLDLCDIKFVTIYINVPQTVRQYRAVGIRGDNNAVYTKRHIDEMHQFNDFRTNALFDYSVVNDDLDKTVRIINEIMQIEQSMNR